MEIIDSPDSLQKGTIAATIGMFDGVHRGHASLINSLKKAASANGLKSAVITFNTHPQFVLNPHTDLKMIMSIDERLEAIRSLGPDDVILMNFTLSLSAMDAFEYIRYIRDHFGVAMLVIGYNHHFGHKSKETFADYVRHGETLGVKIEKAEEYIGPYSPVSSSVIRKLITSGKVDDAKNCLGHPFTIHGEVVRGAGNGRKLGFPTANIGKIDPNIVIPHRGVYAVNVITADGVRRQGMANIGIRPTIEKDGAQSIEVNILDFDAEIYDQPIAAEFIKFFRSEKKMASIEKLRQQLEADKATTRKILEEKQSD